MPGQIREKRQEKLREAPSPDLEGLKLVNFVKNVPEFPIMLENHTDRSTPNLEGFDLFCQNNLVKFRNKAI
jgi:hypothetical protein